MESQRTPLLNHPVWLRPGTSDRQVWADTFTGLYHVPPASMPTPRTVLDVGANIGLTAAHYQLLWPDAEIVAVEMDEDCAAQARMNAPGIVVRCEAVSGQGGWGWYDPTVLAEAFTFTQGGQGGLPSEVVAFNRAEIPEGRLIIQSRTLRQVIRRSFLIPEDGLLDFLKLDIEGTEWDLFDHPAWVPLVRNVLVELHGDGGSAYLVERACAKLTEIGFATAAHHPPHPQAVFASRG